MPDLLIQSRTIFVGIGINEYLHYPNLKNAERDVQSIADLLTKRFGVDESYILNSKEATRAGILNILTFAADRLTSDDSLILYYAGHGSSGRKNKGFWLPVDAQPEKEADSLRNIVIIDKLDEIPMRHLVLFCDSCFSGTLIESGIYRSISDNHNQVLSARKSRWVICSGGSDQVVQDGSPGENSPFASALIKTLSDPLLEEIRIGTLVEELRKLTGNSYQQVLRAGQLQRIGDEGGQYIFRPSGLEEEIWRDCANNNTPAIYLNQYPNGLHAETAKRMIKQAVINESTPVKTADQVELEIHFQTIAHNDLDWFIDTRTNSLGYTWSRIKELANSKMILPSAKDLKSLRHQYQNGLIQELEQQFSFTYPGYYDTNGKIRGRNQLQCFWVSSAGQSEQAFAYIFNRELGRVYEKKLQKNCRLSLLLLKKN